MPTRPRRVVDRLDTRLAHLGRITTSESGTFVVDQANQAFLSLYENGGKPASILVRAGFVARSQRVFVDGDRDLTPRQKPPIATLIRPRGVALRLELALLFLAQSAQHASARVPLQVSAHQGDDDALGLINLFATAPQHRAGSNYARPRPAMRARQVENALEVLASGQQQLVELGARIRRGPGYEVLWLNRETGVPAAKDVSRYTRPKPHDAVISIPIEFFTNGWIQVLTDSEIWNWLVWRHRGNMSDSSRTSATGLRLDAGERLGWYDLTRDAWDTHQLLGSVGLLTANPGEVKSTLTVRGHRFRKEPHEFDLDDAPLTTNAKYAVISAVSYMRDALLDS